MGKCGGTVGVTICGGHIVFMGKTLGKHPTGSGCWATMGLSVTFSGCTGISGL